MVDPEAIDLLTQKVSTLRESLESAARDLAKSAEDLRTLIRKSPLSDLTSSYLAFASAHMRLANATSSEMQRTARAGTYIARVKANQEEESRRKAQRLKAKARRDSQEEASKKEAQRLAEAAAERTPQEEVQATISLPPVDTSFEELYGEVIDAK